MASSPGGLVEEEVLHDEQVDVGERALGDVRMSGCVSENVPADDPQCPEVAGRRGVEHLHRVETRWWSGPARPTRLDPRRGVGDGA